MQAVESLAAATGGTRLPDALSEGALRRLLDDMKSYYRLAIDSSGPRKNHSGPVSVRVARTGLRVGRHRHVLAPRAQAATPASLAEMLSRSVSLSQVELHVASAALFQPEAGDRVQHVVSTRIVQAKAPAHIGFVVVDGGGQSVAVRQAVVEEIGDGGAVFTTALALPVGRYELRVGVRDAAGASGTVFHTVDASPVEVGPFESARLTVLELDTDTGRVAPLLGAVVTGASLTARLDLQIDVEPEDVSFALQRAGDTESALILAAVTPGGPRRWTATGAFPAPAEPGRYVVTATARGLTFETTFEVR